MPKPTKIYWDSCAWLGLLNGDQQKRRELEIVYDNAKKGLCEIWTSTLAYVETNRRKSESGPKPLDPEIEREISALFRQQFVKPIPLDVVIAEHSRVLVRTTPDLSKFKDAIHVASAQWWNIPVLHTYDRADLLHLTNLQCRNGMNLRICYPDETTDGPLFAQNKKVT